MYWFLYLIANIFYNGLSICVYVCVCTVVKISTSDCIFLENFWFAMDF